MSQSITLELTKDRAHSLASIIKAFVLINKFKPGILMKEAEAFLLELGHMPEVESTHQAQEIVPREVSEIYGDMYTDAAGNTFSDADPGL